MQESSQYTVLARRFRPQQFGDVVGQQHIAQALQNAIRSGRVAHAYLFTGARGVGKTSTARILAKALNCPNAVDAVPCNECDICESISAGHDVDVLEIDGASNRRIDDIRDIRANVSVKSMRSKYKVYIIDEVHMLTTEAFNALLKTLEEPPPNVKFVFCTTEPQKVPDTILSRCQRFDFSTIGTESITGRLCQIADAEGYDVDADALELVARRAAGSMRDSQSLFDQLLAFGETHLTAQDVHSLLGTADDDRLIGLFAAIVGKQPSEMFQRLDETIESGVQLAEFIDQCIAFCRDLMLIAAGAEKVALQSVFESNRRTLQEQAQAWGMETIVAALQILADTRNRMTRSVNSRPLAELGLMRLTQLGDLANLSAALRQLSTGQTPLLNPKAAPAGRQASVKASGSPAPGGEKKNRDDLIAESVSAEPPAEIETIELTPENASTFLQRLCTIADKKLQPHLKQCSEAAISGPFRLELVFPVSYDFSREYCHQPANLREIEETASKLAGNRIQVHLTRAAGGNEAESGTKVAQAAPPTDPGRRTTEISEISDEYVKRAADVFGATRVTSQVQRDMPQP